MKTIINRICRVDQADRNFFVPPEAIPAHLQCDHMAEFSEQGAQNGCYDEVLNAGLFYAAFPAIFPKCRMRGTKQRCLPLRRAL